MLYWKPNYSRVCIVLEYNNSYAYSRLVVCIDNRVEMCMKIILQEY